MLRSALATGCGCILGAVAWLPLPRGAFGGGFLRHPGRFPRIFLAASLGTSLPSNPPQRPCHRLWLHSGGSSLASTASRRLCWKLFAASWALSQNFLLQKTTLGTGLPSNPPQRPCHRLWLHSGGSSLASTASRRLCWRLLVAFLALSQNFSNGFRKRR